MSAHRSPGRVYLVGAGPGDPELITLRGVACLEQADVILFDYLVNPVLLRHARPEAERICLGRHGRSRIWPQREVNRELIRQAERGKCVVRLKSGDPAVFARGADEAEALAQHNIPFEIVPGITAALAAGSYAGVPITHRDLASAVALVTGQEGQAKDESHLDYAALARFPGTLVFYMGVTTAAHWTDQLIRHGKPADTPVLIARRCSFPDQLTYRCSLEEVPDHLGSHGRIRPPVVVIVGEVAQLSESLSWFEKRPLFGTRILVTRAAEQADEQIRELASLGADVVAQPAIRIAAPGNWQAVDQSIEQLGQFDWIVFASANGVRFFLDRVLERGDDMRQLGNTKIAAVGPGTARQLAVYRLRADLQPQTHRAEALAEELRPFAAGRRFLLVRANRGRQVLLEQLEAAGAHVTQVIAYESSDIAEAEPEILERVRTGQIDWVTVTSSAIAKSLAAMFGDDLKGLRLASISPLTTRALAEAGFTAAAEAETYTMRGVTEAILRAERDA